MTIIRKLNKKMRNETLISKPPNSLDSFNGDEKEVVKILQQLPRFIFAKSNSSSPPFLLFSWGCKRKRSEINAFPSPPPPPLSHHHHTRAPPPLKKKTSSSLPSSSCHCHCVRAVSRKTFNSTANHPSKDSSLVLNRCCKRKASKKKKKTNLKLEEDSLANLKRVNHQTMLMVMDDYNDNKKVTKLKLQTRRPSIFRQREDFDDSNSSRRPRRSFNLSSVLADCSFSFPNPEREEEGSSTRVASQQQQQQQKQHESSLTSVLGEFGSESMEKSESPYEQIVVSSSDGVAGLGMVKQHSLSPVGDGIPDLNLGPEENIFLHFDMNKEQQPLQMC